MRKNFGREIALLSLPVLLFGGAALFRSMKGRAALSSFLTSNPFDPGPIRLEFSPFQTVEVTPRDVFKSFDWAAQTTVRERGRWNVPAGWKEASSSAGYATDLKLVYRRGTLWKQAPRVGNGEFSQAADGSTIKISVNLDSVPSDANEVRLRGQFKSTHWYVGPLPLGWKPLRNLKVTGPHRILTVESKPFDIPIKLEGEPMPAPIVSKVPDIELVRAVWLHNLSGHQFFILVRHVAPSRDNTKIKDLQILHCVVKDGDGNVIPLFYPRSKTPVKPENTNLSLGFSVIPGLPDDQSATELWSHLLSPRGGWESVKQPLQVEAKIATASDAWPLTARATISQQEGDVDGLESPAIR